VDKEEVWKEEEGLVVGELGRRIQTEVVDGRGGSGKGKEGNVERNHGICIGC